MYLKEKLCSRKSFEMSYGLCEYDEHLSNTQAPSPPHCSAVLSKVLNMTTSVVRTACPRNYAAHNFLVYDQQSACFPPNDVSYRQSRESWALPNKHSNMTSLPPSFTCVSGEEYVPYTLVCDYRQDCLDDSDENFCVFPPCDATRQVQCDSKQCIADDKLCDLIADCLDESDEDRCNFKFVVKRTEHLPALITMNGFSFTAIKLYNWSTPCPNTHFKCLSIEFCMPIYVRCNGVNDCPDKEDEKDCDERKSCPGFYRCRGNMGTFLHPDHLCDGWAQCPQHDDERFCNLACPAQCSCLGHSWFCRQIFQANMYPLIRFLDAENSGMKPSDLTGNIFLIHLGLSRCGVVDFHYLTLPNLHSLDLEGNRIQIVKKADLKRLSRLHILFLAGNPLISVFSARANHTDYFPKLTRLDLSDVKIRSHNWNFLASFPNLQTLNLSGCGIESLPRAVFQNVPKLHELDMRGCPLVSFSTGLLKPLTRLRLVRADNFKVCCSASLSDRYQSIICESPDDKISSCIDLFKSNLLRVSWNIGISSALMCNLVIVFKRLNCRSMMSSSVHSRKKSTVDVFVTSLFVCGCIHAVYMAIIGFVDVSFRGNYMVQDTAWKQRSLCAFAGFLWFFSLETSLFLVGLITLDRVLISWCPRTPMHFSVKSAAAAICVVALSGVFISLVPLLPSLSRGKLFQQTAMCSPLLLSSLDFPGSHYLSVIFSVFNVTISWLVGLGQLSVHVFLHRKRFAFVQSPNETKHISTSRRVTTVVLCDVVYWLVVGHTCHFIAWGLTLPGNVVVLAQVLVMPLSWTLKPVLYAVATLLEHRRRDQEERLLKMLIAKRHELK